MKEIKFGSNVQHYRKKRGLTQEQFAELIEMSQSNLSAIECGTRLPSFEMLIRIIDVLDVTVDDLLEGIIKKGYKSKINRLSYELENLSTEGRNQILAVVETMIENSL